MAGEPVLDACRALPPERGRHRIGSHWRPAELKRGRCVWRELTRHRLGDLARLLDGPFAWDDLVVADGLREALEDFAFEAASGLRSGKPRTPAGFFPAERVWLRCSAGRRGRARPWPLRSSRQTLNSTSFA